MFDFAQKLIEIYNKKRVFLLNFVLLRTFEILNTFIYFFHQMIRLIVYFISLLTCVQLSQKFINDFEISRFWPYVGPQFY